MNIDETNYENKSKTLVEKQVDGDKLTDEEEKSWKEWKKAELAKIKLKVKNKEKLTDEEHWLLDEDRLEKSEERTKKIKERIKKKKTKISNTNRRERTHRLIETGALFEKFYGQQDLQELSNYFAIHYESLKNDFEKWKNPNQQEQKEKEIEELSEKQEEQSSQIDSNEVLQDYASYDKESRTGVL